MVSLVEITQALQQMQLIEQMLDATSKRLDDLTNELSADCDSVKADAINPFAAELAGAFMKCGGSARRYEEQLGRMHRILWAKGPSGMFPGDKDASRAV